MVDYQNRLQKLQKLIAEKNIDLLFIDDPINLYYLTGLTLSLGKLCIPSMGDARLFVDGRYYGQCKQTSPFPLSLKIDNALESYLSSPHFDSFNVFGFDSSRTTYQDYLLLQQLIDSLKTNSARQSLALVPIADPLQKLRSIKDPEEIQLLRTAAALGSQGFDYVCSLLKEGMTEKEVAIELEIFWKRRGGERLAFDSIIAFGANSSMPHYRAGHAKLEKGQTVLIDIGIRCQNYFSDMTRTLFFGNPHPKIAEIYGIVKTAQEKALSLCRPGTLIRDLDKAARDFIADKGYGPAFSHGLGHGIGLEVHEYPSLKNIIPFDQIPLEKGMAITIEPGIYLDGIGGVRIENTIVITENGYEDLTLRSTDLKIIP
jgi:Xaa-Pro aminopeptidase